MASLNQVTLIGNLGTDVELRQTSAGTPVANFSLATNEYFKNKAGEKQQSTEWHRIVVWGKGAETCAQYLSKGRQVFIQGKLKTRKWQDKDGVTRVTTEIHTQGVQFMNDGKRQQVNETPEVTEDVKPEFARAEQELQQFLAEV